MEALLGGAVPGVHELQIESLLEDVHPDDHILVRNLLSLVETLRPYKMVQRYSLKNTKKGYDLIAHFASSEARNGAAGAKGSAVADDIIVSVQDLDIIMNSNPARIATCVVQIPVNSPPQLVVRLLRADQKQVFTDAQVFHIRKKGKWW